MGRIAYLVNRYPEASLSTISREIRAVSALGHEVVRFAHRPSEQPLLSEADVADAAATTYLASGSRWSLVAAILQSAMQRPGLLAKAIRETVRLRKIGPVNAGHLLLACKLASCMKAASVDHLHVHFAMTSAAVAKLARSLGGPPWTLAVHGPEELESSRARMFATLVQASDETIPVSEWAATFVRRVPRPDGHPVGQNLVHMGVDDPFLERPVPLDAAGPMLCIARLERRKGHSVLLDAIGSIRQQQPDLRVELIGDGPLRKSLQTALDRRGLSRHVTLKGWLAPKQVVDSLDRCRCLVLPSLAEGLPVVVMEAFARGRPVIAADVGGITELVRHRFNGLLVPPGNAVQLGGALLELARASPEQLAEMGARGRALVESEYDSARNARKLAAIWSKLRP